MRPSVPAWISRAAIVVGLALFGLTLLYIDREETLKESRRLGLLLPLVLLPSGMWHALRTLGWQMCFPADVRPSFWRLFRVRLAADAVVEMRDGRWATFEVKQPNRGTLRTTSRG